MKWRWFIAIFFLYNGIAIPVTWAVLITSGMVPNLKEELMIFAFHWTAEGSAALMMLISGIALIRKARHMRRIFFFTIGACITAGVGVLAHYAFFDFKPTMLLFIGPMFVAEITFLTKNCESYEDLLHAVPGVIIYGALNMVGVTIHFHQIAMLGYALVMLITGLFAALLLFGNCLTYSKGLAEKASSDAGLGKSESQALYARGPRAAV
jgi:hypothetical protein